MPVKSLTLPHLLVRGLSREKKNSTSSFNPNRILKYSWFVIALKILKQLNTKTHFVQQFRISIQNFSSISILSQPFAKNWHFKQNRYPFFLLSEGVWYKKKSLKYKNTMITYQHSDLAFLLKFCLTHHLNGHIWNHTKEKNQRMAKN